jgi:hypothetical protein
MTKEFPPVEPLGALRFGCHASLGRARDIPAPEVLRPVVRAPSPKEGVHRQEVSSAGRRSRPFPGRASCRGPNARTGGASTPACTVRQDRPASSQ